MEKGQKLGSGQLGLHKYGRFTNFQLSVFSQQNSITAIPITEFSNEKKKGGGGGLGIQLNNGPQGKVMFSMWL